MVHKGKLALRTRVLFFIMYIILFGMLATTGIAIDRLYRIDFPATPLTTWG